MAEGGEKEHKVIVVGSARVGKTSLIQRYLFQEFSYDVPPTAIEERKVVKVGDKQVPLLICDLADRTDLATRGYYAETHAIIFVYDVTNPESLFESSTWIKDIKIYLNERLAQGLPIIFAGNKKDLVKGAPNYDELETSEGARQEFATLKQAKNILKDNFISKLHAEAIECSARTGENVDKVFETVAKRLAGEKPGWCHLF